MDTTILTPVEDHNGIFLKREDFFRIFDVCGSKARMANAIIAKAVETGCNSFCTAGSRYSPQCEIVSNICEHLGKECHVFIPQGSDTSVVDNIKANSYTVLHRTKVGWNNAVVAEAKAYAIKNQSIYIPFGMECDDYIDRTKHQVANIPDQIKKIIVPCGSGMTMASIIAGLECYGMLDKEVVGVVIGKSPDHIIHKYISPNCPIKWSLVKSGMKYGRSPKTTILEDVEVDSIYEAKCIPFVEKGSLLWVVGKRMERKKKIDSSVFENSSSIREAIFLGIKTSGRKACNLAAQIGMPHRRITEYIYGREPIPYVKMERLCKILNLYCSVNDVKYSGQGMFRDCFLKYLEISGEKCLSLSKATGIHPTTLYGFKSGRITLRLRNLEKLVSYCGIKMVGG